MSREFTTGLLCRGMKWVLALTFEGLSGIVPRHLFRRAGFGAPAIEAGNYEEAQAAFQQAQPILDSMVNKGIFAKNKVARSKSRLSAKIKALKSA